jgi:hypothetical protein
VKPRSISSRRHGDFRPRRFDADVRLQNALFDEKKTARPFLSPPAPSQCSHALRLSVVEASAPLTAEFVFMVIDTNVGFGVNWRQHENS